MPMLPRFGLDFELKTVDTTERIIEGYAAIAETTDRVADVIDRKAFSRVQSKAPGDVAVFIAHNMDALPVGIPIDIRFDGTGLWTKTKVFNTHAGDDLLAVAHELKEHGKSLGMSIGYKVMPDGAIRERNAEGKTVRRLIDIDIKEYSFAPSLTIAHPDALVTNVKALSEGLDTAGGYLTEEVISHLRKMHTAHCKDDNCPLVHDDDGEPDDDDGDKTIDDEYLDSDEYKAEREFSSDRREKYAKEGVAMSDGSYPIPDKDALQRAIQSVGRAKDPDAAKKHIKKRAKALGMEDTLPEDWKVINPLFLDNWFEKCGVMGSDGYMRREDIMTASAAINSLSRWIESEIAEGDESKKHVRALYRALVIVSNTLRSEIDEYYADAGNADADATADTDMGDMVEGGKTRPIDEIMLGVLDLDITLAHVR